MRKHDAGADLLDLTKKIMSRLDDDGYPTEDTLSTIEKWEIKTHDDLIALFAYIKSIWAFNHWGWTERTLDAPQTYANATRDKVTVYFISTGGWSGNEELIAALRKNYVAWSMSWRVHRVGGHYKFRVEHLIFK